MNPQDWREESFSSPTPAVETRKVQKRGAGCTCSWLDGPWYCSSVLKQPTSEPPFLLLIQEQLLWAPGYFGDQLCQKRNNVGYGFILLLRRKKLRCLNVGQGSIGGQGAQVGYYTPNLGLPTPCLPSPSCHVSSGVWAPMGRNLCGRLLQKEGAQLMLQAE